MKQNIYKWGLPVAVGICLILTILKMCGLIAIEWAYVFAPIWMPMYWSFYWWLFIIR